MSRRIRIDLEDAADLATLAAAFWRAAKGKRDHPEVLELAADFDAQLARLSREILDLSVSVGSFHTFRIHDPKVRTIHAPCFLERVRPSGGRKPQDAGVSVGSAAAAPKARRRSASGSAI